MVISPFLLSLLKISREMIVRMVRTLAMAAAMP